MKYLPDIKTPESYIYLASPYSGHPFSQHVRYEYTKYVVFQMIEEKLAVYSPIVHFHDLAHSYEMPKDAIFWDLINGAFVQQCSELWVLMLDGWEESLGIKLERDYADNLGKPTRFVYLNDEFQVLVMED